MRNERTSIKVCLAQDLISKSIDAQYIHVSGKIVGLQVFDSKTNLIIPDKTFNLEILRNCYI